MNSSLRGERTSCLAMREMIFEREEMNVTSFLIVTVDLFARCFDDMVNGN